MVWAVEMVGEVTDVTELQGKWCGRIRWYWDGGFWFWFRREVGGEVVSGFDLGFDPELYKRGGLGWWFGPRVWTWFYY